MVGDVVAGRYELVELVGTGGMSSVYRAHDRLLERDVALKVLNENQAADSETLERFRREARAVAQLSHPNVVTVIDRGEDRGRQFIVFELVDGESLKALVDRSGPLPVRRALELVTAVGRGLAYAHERGIVHRDVKPQNVLLDGNGATKVTDFGIARSRDLGGVTLTGTVLGTSSYIAPEQATGGEIGPATDVYSLGVVLYELLTGSVPFAGDNFVAVAMQHVSEPAPLLLERRPDVPARVAHAVERALAKDPEERFPSMGDFVAELEACLGELGGDPDRDATTIVPPRVVRESRPRVDARRRRGRRVALTVAVVLAGAVAALLVARGRLDEPTNGPGPPVALRAVASHDPHGDLGERDDLIPAASDRDAGTYWSTETYYSAFTKPGVGLVLDAARDVDLARLTLVTDTPGFTAEIQAGASVGGPFERVAAARRVGRRTTFRIDGAPARYYVVWITQLDRRAHVNEVAARS